MINWRRGSFKKKRTLKRLFFTTQLLLHFLRMFMRHEHPKELRSLLQAFPFIADFFVLITDHPNKPNLLADFCGVKTVSLDECIHNPALAQSAPLRILSFKRCEEALTMALRPSESCNYATFINKDSMVLFRVGSPCGFAHSIMNQLCLRLNALAAWEFIHTTKSVCLFKDSDSLVPDYEGQKEMNVTTSYAKNPVLKLRRSGWWTFSKKHWIDIIEAHGYDIFGANIRFPLGSVFRASTPCHCFRVDQDPCADRVIVPNIEMAQHVVIAFSSPKIPTILCNKFHVHETRKGYTFALVNNNWSIDNPFGCVCSHGASVGLDQARYCVSNQLMLSPITYNAKFLIYEGVPDQVIRLTEWGSAVELVWKRLSPSLVTILPYQNVPDVVTCTTIERLTIYNVNLYEFPLMHFRVKALKKLVLVALRSSERPWSVSEVLHGYEPEEPFELHVASLENLNPLPWKYQHVEHFAHKLSKLSIYGHKMDLRISFVNFIDVLFPVLRELRMEITHIEYDEFSTVDLPKALFPRLKSLTLCSEVTPLDKLNLLLPPSATTVALSYSICTGIVNINSQPLEIPETQAKRHGWFYEFKLGKSGIYKFAREMKPPYEEYIAPA